MSNQKIFISYSRSDSAEVVKLASRLKQAGANLWLDQLDIPVGAVWDIEIEKALVNCECLIYIVSQASANSNNVLNEVYYALEENKRVLPVKINDCKIPFRIMRLQYIDLFQQPEAGFKQLLTSLQLTEPTGDSGKGDHPGTGPVTEDQEDILWQQTLETNSIAGYKKYLQAYPNGRFKARALAAEKSINQAIIDKANRAKEEKEQKEWRTATQANTLHAFQQYLSQYPSGKYAGQAQQSIKQLQPKPQTQPIIPPYNQPATGGYSSPGGPSNTPLYETSATDNKKIEPIFIWSGIGLVVLIILVVVLNKSNHNPDYSSSTTDSTVTADSIVPAAKIDTSGIFDPVADSTKK